LTLGFDNDVVHRYPPRREVLDLFDRYYAQKIRNGARLGELALPVTGAAKAAALRAAQTAGKKTAADLIAQHANKVPKVPLPGGIKPPPLPPAAQALVTEAGARLSKTAARNLVTDEIKNMGGDLPVGEIVNGLDTLLQDGISAEAAGRIAYSATKTYAESTIQSATGYPIPLPDELSVEGIGKAVVGLIPTDIEGLIDTGLAFGAQAAASALTSVLAGAGVGSVIPGLGTVVGLAVGIGVMALKDLIEGEPPPYQVPCTGRVAHDKPPTNMDAFALQLWALTRYQNVAHIYAFKQRTADTETGYCQGGQISQVLSYYGSIMKKLYDLSKDTPKVMGWAQVNATIASYEKFIAESKYATVLKDGTRVPASESLDPKLRQVRLFAHMEVPRLLYALKQRKVELAKFLSHGRNVLANVKIDDEGRVSGPHQEVHVLRWALVTEMGKAALQAQNQPTAQNKTWFANLTKMYRSMADLEANIRLAAARTMRLGQARARSRLTTGTAAQQKAVLTAHEAEMMKFELGQCGNKACEDRVRKKYATGAEQRKQELLKKIAPTTGGPAGQIATASANCHRLLRQGYGSGISIEFRKKEKHMTPAQKKQMMTICVNQQMGHITKPLAITQLKATMLGVKLPAKKKKTKAPPALSPQMQQMHTQCRALFAAWAQKNPEKAKCLNMQEAQAIFKLCVAAYGEKTLTPAAAVAQTNQIVATACARAGA
jgi:hypothetical protein